MLKTEIVRRNNLVKWRLTSGLRSLQMTDRTCRRLFRPALFQARRIHRQFANQLTRTDDVRRNFSDTTKAKTCLGWRPMVSLDDGLNRTIDWVARGKGHGRTSLSERLQPLRDWNGPVLFVKSLDGGDKANSAARPIPQQGQAYE